MTHYHRHGSGWSSLTTSKLETFYFVWLVLHAYTALTIDCQGVYPSWLIQLFPQFLLDLPKTWDAMSNDPLGRSMMPGFKGRVNEYTWFWALTLGAELLVEIPTAIIGAIGLWKNWRVNWLVLLIYGVTTATTLFPCLATVWYAPPPGAILSDPTMASLSDYHKRIILGAFLPYLIVPLFIAIDAASRIKHFIDISEEVQIKVTKIE